MKYKNLLITLLLYFIVLTNIYPQDDMYLKINKLNNRSQRVKINGNISTFSCSNLFKLNNIGIKLNINGNTNNIFIYMIYKLNNNLSISLNRGGGKIVFQTF